MFAYRDHRGPSLQSQHSRRFGETSTILSGNPPVSTWDTPPAPALERTQVKIATATSPLFDVFGSIEAILDLLRRIALSTVFMQ